MGKIRDGSHEDGGVGSVATRATASGMAAARAGADVGRKVSGRTDGGVRVGSATKWLAVARAAALGKEEARSTE